MRTSVVFWLATLVVVVAGCRPGIGDRADVSLAGTDRVEVRDVEPGGWPPQMRGEPGADVRDEGRLVGTITDPDAIAPLVDALDGARYIDLGRVDYDLPEPDHEVVFLDGDTVLERLGYYHQVSRWGTYRVEGRWFKGWDPLAETVDLPPPFSD